MLEKISQQITNVLSHIPGIASFSSIDFEKKATELKVNDYDKSFKMTPTDKGNVFSVAIIINRNTRAKTICREIVAHLSKFFKDEKIAFNRINVYIRGVK